MCLVRVSLLNNSTQYVVELLSTVVHAITARIIVVVSLIVYAMAVH